MAEFTTTQADYERCKSHLDSSNHARDELTARVDQLSVELRKARMFAAAEEYYIDRCVDDCVAHSRLGEHTMCCKRAWCLCGDDSVG
eukprot:264828-Rhodomonas_salina.5